MFIGRRHIYFNLDLLMPSISFQVVFHFRTTKCDSLKTVIDDSRSMGKPMELVLGKQFKLEVWEVIVQKMSINEVAIFTVDKSVRMTRFLWKYNNLH